MPGNTPTKPFWPHIVCPYCSSDLALYLEDWQEAGWVARFRCQNDRCRPFHPDFQRGCFTPGRPASRHFVANTLYRMGYDVEDMHIMRLPFWVQRWLVKLHLR